MNIIEKLSVDFESSDRVECQVTLCARCVLDTFSMAQHKIHSFAAHR